MAGESFHDLDILAAEAEMDLEELYQEWVDEMVADRAMEQPEPGMQGMEEAAY